MQQMTADFAIHRSIQGLRYIYIYVYNILCICFMIILALFPGLPQKLLKEIKSFSIYHQSIRYYIISIYCAPFCAHIILSIPSKFIIIYTFTSIVSV